MARSGRRRKSGSREPSGKLKRQLDIRDLGTPELRVKKAMALGDTPYTSVTAIRKGGQLVWFRHELVISVDTALSSTALGILKGHDKISQRQMDAGLRYAWVHYQNFPRPYAKISSYAELVAEHLGFDWGPMTQDELELWREYKTLERELRGAGRMLRDETYNAAALNRLPAWFLRQSHGVTVRPGDSRRHEGLKTGLDILADTMS